MIDFGNRCRIALVATLTLLPVVAGAQTYGGPRRHIYVENKNNSIAIYDADASGNVPPVRMIGGSNTGLICPEQMAVDSAGYLYVANFTTVSADCNYLYPGVFGSVLVFSPEANGNVAPARSIAGPITGIINPTSVAIDAFGMLYVGSTVLDGPNADSSLLRFAPGASGNVAPQAALTWEDEVINGVTVDPAIGLIVSFATGTVSNFGITSAYISKDFRSVMGAIDGYDPGAFAVDTSTHTFLGLHFNGSSISRFANRTTGYYDEPGNPRTRISPPRVSRFNVATCPVSIATDVTRTIFVAGQAGSQCPADSISAYSPASTGNAKPFRQISGPATLLAQPTYLTVGP